MATFTQVGSGGAVTAGVPTVTITAGATRTTFNGRAPRSVIYVLKNGVKERQVIVGHSVSEGEVSYVTNKGIVTYSDTIYVADDLMEDLRLNVGDNDNKEFEAKALNCLR